MKQAEFIDAVAAQASESKAQIERVIKAMAAVASKALSDGDDVTIPGLVKMTPKRREARVGRNPSTGVPVDIPAKTVVNAKTVKALANFIA